MKVCAYVCVCVCDVGQGCHATHKMVAGWSRERLEQLVARAVCDMWRKETGSFLSPVSVDGTVCVTCSGSTVVLRVSETFPGTLTDSHVIHTSQSQSSDVSRSMDSGLGVDMTSSDDSVRDASNVGDTSASSRLVPAHAHVTSTPKSALTLQSSWQHLTSGLDLSKRDGDLALSSPQSYTEQVHDVIRQRLVAKVKVSHCKSTPDEGEDSAKRVKLEGLSKHDLELSKAVLSSKQGEGQMMLAPSDACPWNPGLPTHPSASRSQKLPSTQYDRDLAAYSNPFAAPLFSAYGMMPTLQYPAMCGLMPVMPPPSLPSLSPIANPSPPPSLASNKDRAVPISDTCEVSGTGEQKTYRCEYCSKTFLFRSKYLEHLPVHTNARPFRCTVCDRTYKYKYDLRVHHRTHQGIPTKATLCPHCSLRFDTNKLLRQHISSAHSHLPPPDDDSRASDAISASVEDASQESTTLSSPDAQPLSRDTPVPFYHGSHGNQGSRGQSPADWLATGQSQGLSDGSTTSECNAKSYTVPPRTASPALLDKNANIVVHLNS